MEQETRRYNDAEKLQIIEEYMNSSEAMETFQVKYGMEQAVRDPRHKPNGSLTSCLVYA